MKQRGLANSWILLALLSCAGVSHAQNANGVVTAVRDKGVELMDASNNVVGIKPKGPVAPPWPVLLVEGDGRLKIRVDGKEVWVKMTKVVTDIPVTVSASCGPQIALNQRIGGSRGIGEECKNK